MPEPGTRPPPLTEAPASTSASTTAKEQPEREDLADRILDRLDAPISVLGVIFLLVVLADTVIETEGAVATGLTVTGWVLWAVFAAEYALRLVVAGNAGRYLRRTWWQLIFLVLPFLRFVRILARVRALSRLGRAGRVLSSALRSGRTATRRLSSRLGWLAAVTVVVILASSQLLYLSVDGLTYGEALHDTALATITGEPLDREEGIAQVLEVGLALYSVVVFAALAGTLGVYFLERRPEA